jgi:hypothetical protein
LLLSYLLSNAVKYALKSLDTCKALLVLAPWAL